MTARRIADTGTPIPPPAAAPRASWWYRLHEKDREFGRSLLMLFVAGIVIIAVIIVEQWTSMPRVVTVPGPTVTVTATPPAPAPVTTTPSSTPKPTRR